MRYENNSIILCKCKKNSNCPTITPSEVGFDITDDYGGRVQLTKDEFFSLLPQAIKEYQEREQE